MMGQLLGNLLNVILDSVIILGFGWNIAGAAIASLVISLSRKRIDKLIGTNMLYLLQKKDLLDFLEPEIYNDTI